MPTGVFERHGFRNEKSGNSIKQRLEYYSYPDPNTGCWLWGGSCRGPKGHEYGILVLNNKSISAHRLSYETFIGPIPDGMDMLHKCDTTLCINPNHLRPGTHKENMMDCLEKGRNPWMEKRSHCKKGHEFSGYNIIFKIRHDRNGIVERTCRLCVNERRRLNRGDKDV